MSNYRYLVLPHANAPIEMGKEHPTVEAAIRSMRGGVVVVVEPANRQRDAATRLAAFHEAHLAAVTEREERAAARRRRRAHRVPFKFVGREADGRVLVWERPMPGDSRMDQVRCPADWFYGQMMGAK